VQRMAQVGLSSLNLLPHDVVICDKGGRVVFANQAAEERNRRGDGLRFHNSFGASAEAVLTASDPATTSKLLRAIATAATRGVGHERGATLRLPRRDAPIALIAIVTSLPRAFGAGAPLAMVLLSDPLAVDPGYQQRAQTAFALTPAEARLADALVRGLSRAEFAQAVRVKPSTVKTQMQALFAKTDTRRESELIRMLLALPRLAPAR
jgi:DNA-binding CsgD family transcriptional regulator